MRPEPVWWAVGFWTLAAGLVVAVPAAIAGLTDYVTLNAHPAQATATRHMILMLSAVSIGVVRLILQGGPEPPDGNGTWLVAASVAAAIVLTVGARLGGQLVFRHGVGVQTESRD
jgi:uncharacterized membrane protein